MSQFLCVPVNGKVWVALSRPRRGCARSLQALSDPLAPLEMDGPVGEVIVAAIVADVDSWMVRLGGLEPPTKSLGNSCSFHLSYSRRPSGL